ncbi:pore complex protein NUP155 [Seminavis robusta]|uniref:Pore complex protein NUP155 n=1 Tax=Seminavis robusta TaxID=568900 RepID=A0A9N8DL29_9STRA|nr:pore complex protein NUP155 [Seminavis robusta]|eukprot:Sro182_g079370.1 pore complex protein NUP155 (1812) ;mRNA; r:49680-55345
MMKSLPILSDYWKDDFQPLQDAGKDVLAALREDENADDADLFGRIRATDTGGHQYFASADNAQTSTPPIATVGLLAPGIPVATTNAIVPGLTTSPLGSTPSPRQPPTVTLHHERSEPLPALMAQQLQNVRTASLMGLLPEAELAWMTVDDKLFVWPCADSASGDGPAFCSFTVPNGQCVLSVGIVRPKRGVFRPSVKWCLVVTTADEAILCALAEPSDNDSQWTNNGEALMHRNGSLRLVPTLFNVPTDRVRMLSVCGTSDGRIFLGGEDGCLYEMTYEIPINNHSGGSFNATRANTVDQQLEQFYDHGEIIPPTIKDESKKMLNNWALANGKRALSAILPGRSSSGQRPRKCRKLNHSKQIPASVSALVPEFLTKATSLVLGAGKSPSKGGSIVKMLVCEERSCLYTLGSKGWICAFSLKSKDQNNPAKLLAVMNTPEVARLYLDAVARQRINPPSSEIAFGSSAPHGVGGMDGARQILSLSKLGESAANVLVPISLHVVPQKESSKITLIAVTRGGLRYYISSLSSHALNSGPPRSTALTMATGKLTLCHIRAPPPLVPSDRSQDMVIAMDGDQRLAMGGFVPRVGLSGKLPNVDASFWGDGSTVLAIRKTKNQQSRSHQGTPEDSFGDQVVAMSSDFVLRKSTTTTGGIIKTVPAGGVSETLSLPLGQRPSADDSGASLPGGIVSDIAQLAPLDSHVLKLALHSRTPTDTELSVGLVPEFVPGESRASRSSKKAQDAKQSGEVALRRNVSLTSSALMVAMNVIPSLILSRPLRSTIPFQNTISGATQLSRAVPRRFRISNRRGVGGFSLSSADMPSREKPSSSQLKSPRLNPWLLQPAVAPLNQLSIQHLLPKKQMVVMNAGGLHYFQFSSVLSAFEKALRSAGENVETDECVSSFFKGYGYAEGFAMCAVLASGMGGLSLAANNDLKLLAERAALFRMNKSSLKNVVAGDVGFIPESAPGMDQLLPSGYSFEPSSLLCGINKVVARLLRPVWHKPLVVVTEGRTVVLEWSSTRRLTPAKVEFLLDGHTLSQIQNDVNAMAELMKRWFSETIEFVPGVLTKQSHVMDIEEDGTLQTLAMTEAQSRQSQLWQNTNNAQLPDKEKDRIARLTEQRKLHSLYRLVSRSNQLLRLFSLLVRAHETRGLPEVEWGYLHGLTVSQLALSRDGQDRIDKLVNQLIVADEVSQEQLVPSNEADNLAAEFSTQSYLFFSPGSYYAYLGLSFGRRAKAQHPTSPLYTELTVKAAKHFYEASKHWHNSALVCGHSLHTKEQDGYVVVVQSAQAGGSPVAKAAAMLASLRQVDALVDVCLQTAKNFTASNGGRRDRHVKRKLAWESELYHHKRPEATNGSTPKVLGKNVTSKDAITTCRSLIFYHITMALKNPGDYALGVQMLSRCASETDKEFLHELFGVVAESGHSETLIKVRSNALEEWLSLNNRDLLYSYYTEFGRLSEAGNIAFQDGTDNTKPTPLAKRLESLTRAFGAYESAAGSQGNRGNFYHVQNEFTQKRDQARDWFDMGKLQSRILEELSRQTTEQFDEREELSFNLVDASRLFDVASKHGLSHICVLLMAQCGSDDNIHVLTMWRNVFCGWIFVIATRNEDLRQWLIQFHAEYSKDPLVELVTGTSESTIPLFEEGKWAQILEQKMISLGREVLTAGAAKYVPVESLLRELEELRLKYGEVALEGAVRLDPGWSLQIFLEIGVPYVDVLRGWEALHAQERNALRLTAAGGDGAHYLDRYRGILVVLEIWLTKAAADQRSKEELSRAVFSSNLYESIRTWKHELERAGVSNLQHSLEEVEKEIRMMDPRY